MRPVTFLAAGALVLTACGSSPLQPSALLAQSLADVRAESGSTALVIYDLSQPLLEQEASYDAMSDEQQWTVVVACPLYAMDQETVVAPLGVVPSVGVSEDMVERARDGQFDKYLVECGPEFDPETPVDS